MHPVRSLLLAASENRWMRAHATRLPVFRRAVRRFMPGERLEDALDAAALLREAHLPVILTRLGENVRERSEADAVAAHYLQAFATVAARGLDAQVSVKLTQLGLDLDPACCRDHVRRLAERSAVNGAMLWIDMEQHAYVDRTLELYHTVLGEYRNVGVCLQAYLRRTPQDLDAIVAAGGGVRLVKGAYREPASVAYPRKSDVDARYLSLAKRMLADDARARGLRPVFGTHDVTLIEALRQHARSTGVEAGACEFALLYGIQRGVQRQLARAGERVRVLVSYGEYWFPWYMRRLAERPANVLFVARSAITR